MNQPPPDPLHRVTTENALDGVHLRCACGWQSFVSRVDCMVAADARQLSPVKQAIDAHWAGQEPPPPPDTKEERVLRALNSSAWALGLCMGMLSREELLEDDVREAVERAMACINAVKEENNHHG